jgi:hypothetical protein
LVNWVRASIPGQLFLTLVGKRFSMAASWSATQEPLPTAGTLKFVLSRNGQGATYAEVTVAWQHDEDFRKWFNQLLADCPYQSFRWETPAVSTNNFDRPFEFVVIDSPNLAPRPDRNAFAEHFYLAGEEESVVTFANLGRNALLVVPCPLVADQHYPHLGAFVRGAPAAQRDRLWQCAGEALAKRLSDRPVWLSTAGAGVSWLHVRLDNSPKYYLYMRYRNA